MSWSVTAENPVTGDCLGVDVHEVDLVTGDTVERRPYRVSFSGEYPQAFDGLAALLSADMTVIDPSWVAMKLRKLLNYFEPSESFMAVVPGDKERRQQMYPSTVAYIARLIIHRYAMLGILDEAGYPVNGNVAPDEPKKQKGKPCPECGKATLVKKDGCTFCTACGYVGQCS
jgi:ribonucleoside-diphosphate reductase alpha chain